MMNERSPGFTLVELLVVTVVTAVMLAAVIQTLVVQQQSYRQQMVMVNTRQTARTALELLATELREVSATGGDFYVTTADSIHFRAYRKFGIVCENFVGSRIEIWELGEPFAVGDSVLVFADGDPNVATDDAWLVGKVNSRGSGGSCSDTWSATQDYPKAALVHNPPLSVTTVLPGAPVRTFEDITYGRYELDGEWVVGRRKGDGAAQALVGPIAPGDGLVFRYYDENGQRFDPVDAGGRAKIRRIEIVVKGRSIGGATGGEFVDSLVTQVRLRGNA